MWIYSNQSWNDKRPRQFAVVQRLIRRWQLGRESEERRKERRKALSDESSTTQRHRLCSLDPHSSSLLLENDVGRGRPCWCAYSFLQKDKVCFVCQMWKRTCCSRECNRIRMCQGDRVGVENTILTHIVILTCVYSQTDFISNEQSQKYFFRRRCDKTLHLLITSWYHDRQS
jgi:hypothetical protein